MATATSDWPRCERIEDSIDHVTAQTLSEETLDEFRKSAQTLLHSVWSNKEGKMCMEGPIPGKEHQ